MGDDNVVEVGQQDAGWDQGRGCLEIMLKATKAVEDFTFSVLNSETMLQDLARNKIVFPSILNKLGITLF